MISKNAAKAVVVSLALVRKDFKTEVSAVLELRTATLGIE
jgi:hypothetical protein